MSAMDPQNFTEFQQTLLKCLVDTTKASGVVASQDLAFQKSIDPSINRPLSQCSERLSRLTRSLLSLCTEQDAPPIEDEDDVEGQWSSIIDTIDGLMEKTDACLDEFHGQARRSELQQSQSQAQAQDQPIENGTTRPPARATPSKMAIARAGLPREFQPSGTLKRPQLMFKEDPDNTDKPWLPRLTEKPHAQVPLDKAPVYTTRDDGAFEYAHPYRKEIEESRYPAFILDEIITQPTPIAAPIWVDDWESLQSMLSDLRDSKEIAVDLEHHDQFSYRGFVCLMQISNREKDWIVDTLKLRSELEILNEVFADPNKIKVLHGANSDVVWLQRDFGLYLVNLFDTYFASRYLALSAHGLAHLLQAFCDFEADKRFQMADWRIRPLPKEMLEYAQSDTHFLLYIYDQLRLRLKSGGKAGLRTVHTQSKEIALKVYAKTPYLKSSQPTDINLGSATLRALNKYEWDQKRYLVFLELHRWRDQKARELDENPLNFLTNTALVDIAQGMPRFAGEVRRLAFKTSPSLIQEIVDVVRTSLRKDWTGGNFALPPFSTRDSNKGSHTKTPSTVHLPQKQIFDVDKERANSLEANASRLWPRQRMAEAPVDESHESVKESARMHVVLPALTAEIFQDGPAHGPPKQNGTHNDGGASLAEHEYKPSAPNAPQESRHDIVTVRELGRKNKKGKRKSDGEQKLAGPGDQTEKPEGIQNTQSEGSDEPVVDHGANSSSFRGSLGRPVAKKAKSKGSNEPFKVVIQEDERVPRNSRETMKKGSYETGKSMSFA